MKRIYKYSIKNRHHECATNIELPINSKLLDIESQNDTLFAWFEIDIEEREREIRKFVCMYTGSPFNNMNLKFRKTIVFHSRVVHIYEKIEEKFLSEEEMEI